MKKGPELDQGELGPKAMGRRVTDEEVGSFLLRLKEVIGEKSISSFARECGVGESTLRNILAGAWPRTDILVSIGNAAGVSIDWLATGYLPKVRGPRPVGARVSSDGSVLPDSRREMLEMVLRVAEGRISKAEVTPEVIDAVLTGAPAWMESVRDYPDLAPRFRAMIATIEFINAVGGGQKLEG